MISLFQFSLNINVRKDAENSFCAALAHRQQLHPSPLELGCRQEQHDLLDTHHFETNNARFAQAAWNCSWGDAFSTTNPATQRRRTAYTPQSIEAEVRMHAAAQRLLNRIKRQQTSVTASPLKRLIRMTLGT